MDYKIYKDEEIELKGEERKIHFSKNLCSAVLVVSDYIYKSVNMSFLDFYATSNDWQKFTETGYRSIQFYFDDKSDLLDDEKIITFFLKVLENSKFEFIEQKQLSIF